jgi:hypothetical protein
MLANIAASPRMTSRRDVADESTLVSVAAAEAATRVQFMGCRFSKWVQ